MAVVFLDLDQGTRYSGMPETVRQRARASTEPLGKSTATGAEALLCSLMTGGKSRVEHAELSGCDPLTPRQT